jgi:hypothetical protein
MTYEEYTSTSKYETNSPGRETDMKLLFIIHNIRPTITTNVGNTQSASIDRVRCAVQPTIQVLLQIQIRNRLSGKTSKIVYNINHA